ncbi:ATP-binding protein [Streptomyces sp. UG1]|uniref:ATP-binding protein n=1 Tax=Streptomyces sp. UG1 TaxID=3417652 RepID=UPI003CF2D6CE
MDGARCVRRKPWKLPFLAEPEEVASLRRVLRTHLTLWGLHESIELAQLCVSELVANVIDHVGSGTPATLVVCMNRAHLRIEVHDPDTRALPFLKDAGADSETGRGVALVDAVTDRWGVDLHADRKVTWCELAVRDRGEPNPSRLTMRVTEEAAIDVITDLLHWLRVHGCDADEVLDQAQTHFEVQVAGSEGQSRQAV